MNLENILPDTIYKYRELNNLKHLRIITHQEIYYSNPSDFNAHYDCEYKLDREFIKDENNRRIYYSKYLNTPLNSPLIDKYIIENPITDKLLDEREKFGKNWFHSHYGIFSASETYKSNHLWEIFGQNKKGFCVGIDFKAFPLNEGIKGKVKYVNDNQLPLCKVLNHDDLSEIIVYFSNLITTLPERYEEEKEYRIGKLISKEEDRIKIIDKKHIKSIIVGEKMSKLNQSKLIDLVNNYTPNTIIKRLKYANGKIIENIIN